MGDASGGRLVLSRRKELVFCVLAPIVTITVVLLVIEAVLRFLPVSSGLRSLPVTPDSPIFRFTPDRPFVNSFGWDMHNVVRGRVNNAGFVNDQDYRADDPLPLLAVIGDSYIEAQMVPYAETMHGRLARVLAGKARVYSFAASGAPLSQYLIWAGYAIREYGAKLVVINVVGNDFHESLLAYKVGPGFWLYAPDGDVLRLRLTEHRPGWAIAIARESALVRYIIVNLSLHSTIFRVRELGELIFGRPANAAPSFGNTGPDTSGALVRDSLAAIDAFFRDLPAVGLPPERVLFTVDGFRYPDAMADGRETYFDLIRRAFFAKAKSLGYEAIDLDPRFAERHAQTGERFGFPDDGHWNANGHAVAAQAVLSSQSLMRSLQ